MMGAASNSYTGTTTVNAGTLVLNKFDTDSGTSSTAIPGDLMINGGTVVLDEANQTATTSSVTISSPGALQMAGNDDTIGTLTLDNTSLDTGAATLTLTGDLSNDSSGTQVRLAGHLALTTGIHTFDITDPVSPSVPDMVVSAAISGTGEFTKTGNGNLELSGAESFTGPLEVASGILTTAPGASFAGSITIDSGAELDLTGGVILSAPITATGTGSSGGGAIVNTGGTSTLSGTMSLSGAATIDVASGGLTISGAIGGTGPLIAAGGSTLTLTNANTYSGGTTISAGSTLAASSGALGTGAVTDDGELDLNNTNLSNAITLASTGNAIVNTGGTSSLNGAITLGADATIDVASGSTLMFFGAIGDGSPSNGYGLTETGGGLLITAATTSNTYTGTTTIDSGTFELDQQWGSYAIQGPLTIGDGTDTAEVLNWQNNEFGPGVAVTLNGANATLNLNGLVDTVASLTFYGGSATTGAGTLTLGGNVTTEGTSDESTISGNLALADGVTHVLTVPYGGTASGTDLDISAVLSGDSTAGLTETGGGTLSLDADSTAGYAGAVTIQQGTLQVTASGALGTGPVEIDDPAEMALDGSGADITLQNAFTLKSTANEIVSLAGSNTLSESITLQADASIDVESGSTLTISGAIGDGGGGFGVTEIGEGTMVYAASQANTYTGTTTVGLGELDFDSTAANGGIAGPLQIGTSPFGSATVKYLASSQVPSTTDVTVFDSQAELDLNGHSDSINDLTVNYGTVSLPAGSSLTAAGLTMTGGDINTGTGSTFTLAGDATINDSTSGSTIDGTGSLNLGAGTPTLTINATTPAIGLNIAVPIVGTGGLTQTGAGTMEFSATSADTYTGTTTVDQGTLLLSDSGGEAITGDLVVGDGTHTALVQEQQFTQTDSSNTDITVNASATFDFNGYDDYLDSMDVEGGTVTAGGAFVTLGGSLTMTGGSVTTQSNGNFRLANNVTINAASTKATIAGTLDLAAATQTFTVARGTDPSGIDLDISAAIYNGGVIKAGVGTMALDASNTYTGGTTINAGILKITNGGGLGSGSATVGSTGDLQLAGNLTVTNDLTLNSSGAPALEGVSGTNTLNGSITFDQSATIAVDAGTLELGGNVVEGGSGSALTKTGSGTLQLVGTNTYGGGTTVTAGILQVFSSQPTGTAGTVEVEGGANLRLSATSYTLPSGGLQLDGGATLLTVSSSAYTINGGITLAGDTAIDVLSIGSLKVSGAIGGGHGLTANGTGTLILTGSSNYTGATTVSGGTLEVDGSIAGSSGVTVENGATLDGEGTVPEVTVQAGGTLEPASGSATAVLNSSGDVNFDTGSTFSVTIGGATPGTNYGQLSANGTAEFDADSNGGATLSVSLAPGYIPKPNTQYVIVSAGTVSDTFNGLPNGSTIQAADSDYSFRINYVGDAVILTSLARTDTWTGGDDTGNWSDPLNWQGDYVPGKYDALVFPSNTSPSALNNDLAANMEFTSIEIDAAGLGFSGSQIVLDSGITTGYGTGTSTFAIDTVITGNAIFNVASSGTLDVSGVLSGSANLLQLGGGTLQLDAANTYTGGTSVAGILEVTNDDALGQNGGAGVTVYSELIATNGITLAPTSLTIYGSGVDGAGALVLDDGANADPGTFTLGSDATIGVTNGSSSIGTAIGDGGGGYGVTVVGGGTLTLTAVNTYTGTTDVTAGTLELDDTAGPALAGPLTIGASGGGDVLVQDEAPNQLTASTDVTLIGSGATFDLNDNDDAIQSLTFTGGTVSTGTGTLTLGAGGVSTNAAATTAQITGHLDLGAGTPTFTVAQGTVPGGVDLSIPAVVSDGGLIKAGAGLLALSGANSYAGGTTVNDGVINVQSNSAGFGTGTVTINSDSVAMTRGEVMIGSSSVLTIANSFVLNSSDAAGDPAIQNTRGVTLIGGTITLQANATIDVNSASILDFTGSISGPYSLTEIDGGRLVLGNSNSYSGGTIVNAGQLAIDTPTNAAGSGAITINNAGQMLIFKESYYTSVTMNNAITLNSTSMAAIDNMGGTNTLTGAITLGRSATINAESGTTLIINGAIDDGGNGYGITKGAPGTVELEGASTYTGSTTVSAGTLQVDGSIAASSGIRVNSGGTLTGSGSVPAITGTSGGTIAPGTPSGPAIVNSGSVSLATGSAFNVVLKSTTPGSGYDQLNVTGTVNLDSGSTSGATLNVTLGYTPAIGDSFVLIANDGTDPVQGTFKNLPEGATLTINGQNLEISYQGGPNQNEVVLTDKATPTVAVNAAPNPSQYGQSVTFSVTVSGSDGTPTGTVTFYDGNPTSGGTQIGTTQTLDGSGDASVSTSSLTGGTHPIYAVYSGDAYYLTLTNSLAGGQVVTPDATTTGVSSAQSSTVYGTPVIFTALVTQAYGGTPTGLVDFFDGSTPLGSAPLNSLGIATLAPTTLSAIASPHSITASYEGNSDSQGSTSSAYSQTITPAALTIAANDVSKTYGQTTTFAGTEFTTSGLVNGDTVSSATLDSLGAAATAIVAGSPYTITVSVAVGTGLGNYTITYDTGQLTVNPAPLTITASDTSKTYGQATTFAGTESTASGLLNSDSVSSVTLNSPGAAATAGVAGSPYAITASAAVGTGLGNYTITYATGQLTVNTAGLTITAKNVSKTYGQTLTFAGTEFTTSGLLNSDSVTFVALSSPGAAATASVAGSPYAITAANAVGTGLGNYTITYATGQLTVNAAPLTVTAKNTSKTYGQTLTFAGTEFTASGLLNSDSVASVFLTSPGAAATVTVAGSPYAITPSNAVGTGLGNYTITYAPGQLAVNPAGLTIIPTDTSKTYGQTLSFAGTEFIAPGLVNGDAVTSVSLTSPGAAATAGVAGSPYVIAASNAVGTGLGNYTITYSIGDLTVNPAPLTITANDQSRAYGAPNPTLTASYSGFVNGDTPASLTTPVILTTPAPSVSPIGTYPINAAGATSTNYAITFHAGTLTIARASSQVTMVKPGGTSVFGQAVSFTALVSTAATVPTGVVNFYVDGTLSGSAPINPSTGLATFTTTAPGVGAHAITASYAGDTNFLGSQSGAIQQAVGQADSQSVVSAQLVRNRRGQVVEVDLDAGVLAVAPGGGTPTGTVSFFSGRRKLGSAALRGGKAVLALRPARLLNTSVRVQYTGDANFHSSVSSPVLVTQRTKTAMARPFFAFARSAHRGR
jgi:autotransporter-associated beta strand protein